MSIIKRLESGIGIVVPLGLLLLAVPTLAPSAAQTKVQCYQVNDIPCLDTANVFTVNQRINAGLGVNVAPGATGTLSLSDGIFERSRAFKMGDWNAVTYSAGNFTASTGTWTVDSGDQVTFRYMVVGHTEYVQLNLQTTSVSSTPAQLIVAVPGGFTVANLFRFPVAVVSDAGGNFAAGQVAASAGATSILFFPNATATGTWTASTNTTSIVANVFFEVQ